MISTDTLIGLVVVASTLSTIGVDYFMFAVILPRVFNRALKKQAEKYNPKTNEGLNVDVAYNQNFSGINTELFGLHLRGQNIGSIISTIGNMLSGKKNPVLVGQEVESILKSDIPLEEKLRRILQKVG
jgi:hypothetical protein